MEDGDGGCEPPTQDPAEGWRWLLPWATTRRGALVAAVYYLLSILPAAAFGGVAAVRGYWFVSSLCLATGVLWLHARGGLARAAAFAVNAVAALGNLLLAVSLTIQGTGFNAQFFYHLDVETWLAVKGAFVSIGVFGAAYVVFVSLWPALLPNANVTARLAPAGWARAVAAVLGVTATLNAVVLSLAWHFGAELVRATGIVLVPKPVVEVVATPGADARNLVVVVVESLEATYSRSDLIGAELTPGLTSLSAEAIRFADVRQVSHTGWTTGALVAASCGVPMAPDIDFRRGFPAPDVQMLGAVCIGDVLQAHGYRTVFMVGHALTFAGLGDFLAAHGFPERHGLRSLQMRLADPSYRNHWGLFDDSLLAMARERLRELAAGEGPFALFVLTMDTHFPVGYPSASCGARDDPTIAFVVRCADKLLASFISDVRATYPNTVVALYSDHLSRESLRRQGLASPGGPLDSDDLGILGLVNLPRDLGARRLRFAMWDPTRPPEVVHRAGTHFDIMPTVLDVLGLDDWSEHGFGTSLLRASSPWLAWPNPDALEIVQDLPALRLEAGDEVSFDARGPIIELDGQHLLATGRGLTLDNAVFALSLAEDGTVAKVLDTQAFEAIVAGGAAPAVVGISSRRDVNRHLLLAGGENVAAAIPDLAFFAGRPGTSDFMAGALAPSERHTVQMR